jgi:hypothetical protein
MTMNKRILAATELVLIFPAALFMTAVVARHLQPLHYEPAHTAQQIVAWYAGRYWTLWLLLIGLPLGAVLTGSVTLLGQSSAMVRRDLATRIIAAATVSAAAVLVVVALHMLAN